MRRLSKNETRFAGRDERQSRIKCRSDERQSYRFSCRKRQSPSKRLLNLSTLGRTVTIRMPWHVSSILPFLHVIQGGVSWWTDPNRAVLNKPSGFLVCATEGGGRGGGLFEKQTVVPSNLPLWGFQWKWVQTVGRSALEAQPHNPVCVNVKTNNVTARLICLYFNHLVLEKLS